MMETLQAFGISLIQLLQTLSPALDAPMEFFTFMGRVEFYMIFVTFLYWVLNSQLGLRVFLVLIGTDIIGITSKQLLRQPRPYWIGGVKGMGVETTYGIPSTHASDSLSVWGYLAYKVQRRWLWWLVVAIVLLISFSRLYLGVHFPHDILGGWLIGLVAAYVFVKQEARISEWLNGKSLGFQIQLVLGVSILFLLVGVIVQGLIAGSQDPASWASFASEARSISGYFTLGGAFFGAGAGYALMRQRARFSTGGGWLQRIGRYLFGLVGLAVILFGLDAVFGLIARDESALGYLLRYIRYGATTFWAMFGAPWVFLKIKLAAPDEG